MSLPKTVPVSPDASATSSSTPTASRSARPSTSSSPRPSRPTRLSRHQPGQNPTTRAMRRPRASTRVTRRRHACRRSPTTPTATPTRWRPIAEANGIDNPLRLRRGTELTHPEARDLMPAPTPRTHVAALHDHRQRRRARPERARPAQRDQGRRLPAPARRLHDRAAHLPEGRGRSTRSRSIIGGKLEVRLGATRSSATADAVQGRDRHARARVQAGRRRAARARATTSRTC